MLRSRMLSIFLFSCLAVLLMGLSKNHYSKHEKYSYRSSLWGDKAGYYIYLPMALIHGFQVDKLENGIEARFGYGFRVEDDKVRTKYTSGLAMLSLPFFLMIHWLALLFGFPADGFSPIYFYLPVIAGPFYAALGIACLYAFLKKYFNTILAIVAPLVLFFTTNAFYYATTEAYMSHIYSFALISALLYLVKLQVDHGFRNKWQFALLAFIMALIVLIRPTNIVVVLLIFLLDVDSAKVLKSRFIQVFSLSNLVILVAAGILVFLPQILYWQYAYGSLLPYTYEGERFDYLLNPQIIPVLFAPQSGMLPYAPFFGLLILALMASWFIKENRWNSLSLSLVIMLGLYLIASWGCFYYGCSFGSRPLVDYIPLFALPFAATVQYLRRSRLRPVLIVMALIAMYSSYYTISVAKPHDGCYYGSLWQWRALKNYIDKAKIFPLDSNSWTITNSFEPDAQDFYHDSPAVLELKDAHSGSFVGYTDSASPFSGGFLVKAFDVSLLPLQRVDVQLYIRKLVTLKNCILICQAVLDTDTLFVESVSIKNDLVSTEGWTCVTHTFHIPEIHIQSLLKFSVWALEGERVYVDDMALTFHY